MFRGNALASLVAVALLGCLPDDARIPPTALHFRATSSEVAQLGVLNTSDGWEIRFEKLLMLIGDGNAGADGDGQSCKLYSSDPYMRLLNLRVPGTQKVNDIFALGFCDFEYRIDAYTDDRLLGSQVTDEDVALMSFKESWGLWYPAALYMQGSASKGQDHVRFGWGLNKQSYYQKCWSASSGGLRNLKSDAVVYADVLVEPELLFLDDQDDALARLRFQAFFDADALNGDADGNITRDELKAMSMETVAANGGYTNLPPWVSTLYDFVENVNFKKLARNFSDGTRCNSAY